MENVLIKCPDCGGWQKVSGVRVRGVAGPMWLCGACGIFFGKDRVPPKPKAGPARQLVLGVMIGAVLTSSLGLAQNIYDRSGQPAAPRGSVQQFDYFRQRQQQLDVQALRRQAEQRGVPCER